VWKKVISFLRNSFWVFLVFFGGIETQVVGCGRGTTLATITRTIWDYMGTKPTYYVTIWVSLAPHFFTIYFIASCSPFFFSPAARFIYFWHLIASMSFVQMRRGSSVVGHFRRSLLACTSVVGHFWWGPYVSLNQTFSIHTKHCRDTASQSAPWPRCQSRIVIGSWLDLTLTRKSWLDFVKTCFELHK
jgi:hypothetical protein